jgi:transcription-repair coupling factor (superfamily II helicase)
MSDLGKLLNLVESLPAWRQLQDELKHSSDSKAIVPEAARPYVIAALYHSLRLPVLVITAQPENSKKLHEQLLSWCPSCKARLFPEPDTLPYERLSTDSAAEIERVQVFTWLAGCAAGESADDLPLVVASVPAFMGKTPASQDFASVCHKVEQGMVVDPLVLLKRWEKLGYRMENLVEVPGAMSHRGGIIDVYPPSNELPVRIEFFGDTIDSIRLFDPSSQRSVEKVTSVFVSPATELLSPRLMARSDLEKVLRGLDLSGCTAEIKQQFEQEIEAMLEGQQPHEVQFYASLFNMGCLLDYLPPDTLVILDESQGIQNAVSELSKEAERLRSEKLERGELPRDFPVPYFNWEELESRLNGKPRLGLLSFGIGEKELKFASAPGYAGQLPAFLSKTKKLIDEGNRIVIVSHQANRLSDLLAGEDIIAAPVQEVTQSPPAGALTLVQGSLPEGWVMNKDIYLLTDNEIFGFVKQRRLVKKRPAERHKLMADIKTGDFVVHVEHGIGKLIGVKTLNLAGTDKEYLVLQYGAGDTLYVPTDQIDRVSRYIGAGDRPPVLSRLNTMEWSRSKQRAKEAAEELAKELLALYATRETVSGFAFSPDTVWQQEMEAAFPYVETPDQLEAQRQVKEDMEKIKPMDRLVCGDVGYGKTEVAIRAAFKAVMDGKQVAVLVPTTILAQQHYITFSERLEAFPVKVESLSRFRSPAEQHAVIKGLADGSVDICIGTHRLLQKDILFKDLGLLIIDEEQRFGVKHKEYLKKKRQEVDVLTLSATPIPRTLHMSLVGVRDMSTMETPPEDRLPVKTYVAEYHDRLVREAVLRELERNGQVFFVHNRVQSIAMIADKLRALIPEARVAVGHGQMPEEELEAVMSDFGQGKYDILVCSTIIESGLDMPNVNTMIINQADRFGLAQLYQLRGRIGRGANLAYAYFLYDGGKNITPSAQKRLRTIYEATELGAGFGLAMKDLEIRGAGTLLGPRQSGHITAIGFSLYTRLLAEAVEERKARISGVKEPQPRLPEPTIELPLDAYLPESYVADIETRLELYRSLTAPHADERLDDIEREYLDRFGTPPQEVQNLFYAVRIKGLAAKAAIESIGTEEGQILIRRFPDIPFVRQKIASLLKDGITLGNTQLRLNYKKLGSQWKGILEEILGRIVT